jgi:hypothetical protein
VNLAIIGGMILVGLALTRHYRLSPWWALGVVLAMNPGIATMRNLTDPAGMLGCLWLSWAWVTRQSLFHIATATAFSLFAREQNIAFVGWLGLFTLIGRRWNQAAAMTLATACYAIWFGWMWSHYQRPPFMAGAGNLRLPFVGMTERWIFIFSQPSIEWTGENMTAFGIHLHLTAMFLLAIYCMIYRRCEEAVIASAGVWLFLCAGEYILCDIHSCARVFVWLPLGLWMCAARYRMKWLMWLTTIGGYWSFENLSRCF